MSPNNKNVYIFPFLDGKCVYFYANRSKKYRLSNYIIFNKTILNNY